MVSISFGGVHGMFVWRQSCLNRIFCRAFVVWRRAGELGKRLFSCARCDGLFLPGQTMLTLIDQIQTPISVRRPPSQATVAPPLGAEGG